MDAVIGITGLVEALHNTISRGAFIRGRSADGRTKGITGLVYRNIRSTTKMVGDQLEPLLEQVADLTEKQESTPQREAIRSALNGVLGDHLVARKNPLAIPMQLRQKGEPISERELAQSIAQTQGRLLVLVHGLCMNDLQWLRKGHNHGVSLAQDLPITPVYLHYNSGCHISENGRSFSALMETTLAKIEAHTKHPIELYILGHSMGGLVSRSACHYAKKSEMLWQKRLKKMVFLGTPHQGALLEKSGNLIDMLLEISPYSAPFARLGKIRSSGITDLRHAYLVDEDWQGRDRFNPESRHRTHVDLPAEVASYALAGSISKKPIPMEVDLIGDGLVGLPSALGHHRDPARRLTFPKYHQWTGNGINHLDLLNHREVYAMLRHWLQA
jgi:pimeloyl-ACP methyl ester carboxylesterase